MRISLLLHCRKLRRVSFKTLFKMLLTATGGFCLGSFSWAGILMLEASNTDDVQRFLSSQIRLEERYIYEHEYSNQLHDLWTLFAGPLSAAKLYAIFSVGEPSSSSLLEVIGKVAVGKTTWYSIRARIRSSDEYPVKLRVKHYLRVSILAPGKHEMSFEDLNSDGVFDVRRVVDEGKTLRLHLLSKGDWINMDPTPWEGAIVGGGSSIQLGGVEALWDGDKWILNE